MSRPLPIEKNVLYAIIAVAAVIVIAVIYFAVSAPSAAGPAEKGTPTPAPGPAAWKVGSYAEYRLVMQGKESTLKYSVDGEEVYNGQDCYLLTYTMTMGNQRTEYTMWITKAEHKPVHARMRMYQGDTLIMEKEMDVKQAEEMLPPSATAGEKAKFLGYETITVPAGTFNCAKYEAEVTQAGVTTKTTFWLSNNVPMFGLVKAESVQNGNVVSTMELISYGT